MGAREVYQRTKKVPDLFWNRFVCRPVAAVVVSAVKDTRVTPNQLTLASFALGMAAAAVDPERDQHFITGRLNGHDVGARRGDERN